LARMAISFCALFGWSEFSLPVVSPSRPSMPARSRPGIERRARWWLRGPCWLALRSSRTTFTTCRRFRPENSLLDIHPILAELEPCTKRASQSHHDLRTLHALFQLLTRIASKNLVGFGSRVDSDVDCAGVCAEIWLPRICRCECCSALQLT
jgi:hypothetical protein